jgi:hypothetical protein
MDRSLFKLLLISALSAVLVVPLFFYSRSLMHQAEQALAAEKAAAESVEEEAKSAHSDQTDASTEDGHKDAADDSAHGGQPHQAQAASHGESPVSASARTETKTAVAEAGGNKAQEEEAAQAYKPPLFGACKRMFQDLQKREVAEGEYKAFAFAFDGKVANCADYVSNKSLRHARAVVVKNCQEERHDKRYVPCLLYEVQ